MKFCHKCGDWLPNLGFARTKRTKDGLQSACRICHRKMMVAYEKSPKGREVRRRIEKKVVADGCRSAYTAVWRAKAAGLLVKRPCEVCGTENSQAHHHKGYSNEHRLDVRWLCPQHHSDEHAS